MIDTADLQAFLSKIEGGAVAVDLLKIGQTIHQQHAASGSKNKFNTGKFRLALDMEDCLDRFYGGYYSDWACGGQWNRAYQFVQLLANAFKLAHVDVIAFFDGTLKEYKKQSFERNDFRQKTISVLKHIRMIGTPPPKIWWLPPSGIRTCLRNALRNLNIQVVQTVNDHTMEVIEYFHEHKLDGILGVHPDYIIANTNRYFSSHDLRLSYKGSLETKEYLNTKLLTSLSLTADHLPFVAVFLGGYILIDDTMLRNIYTKINVDYTSDYEARIKKLAEIVRNSPTNEIDEFIKHLNLGEWAAQIKESVEYYQRKGKFSAHKYANNKKKQNLPITSIPSTKESAKTTIDLSKIEAVPMASETSEHDEFARKLLNDVNSLVDEGDIDIDELTAKTEEITLAAEKKTAAGSSNSNKNTKNKTKITVPFVYTLPGEVLKTSLNRHQRGIMDARIYQLLTKKEIFLPQILEDEQYREIPSIHLFYRPARQMIYAILFNLYHQKFMCARREKDHKNSHKIELPDVAIKEWIWSPQNEYKKSESVNATLLPWAVPTIQRLWFGTVFEDKQRRMKAFLSVMRSDSPLMLNRGYVPQHMLAMACVLRYIVTNPDRNILSRQELDAFLATAFSPHIINIEYTQELVLPGVHLRGVYLASLFMQGVETASLANDACGVPLPWTMTNPWLFFDGKLFHLKLKMSACVQSLRELCDEQIDIVLKIERFRKAILEDVEHFLLPAHMDPMYRGNFLPAVVSQAYGKNQIHPLSNISPLSNGTTYYNAAAPPQSAFYHNVASSIRGNLANNLRGRRNNMTLQQQVQQQQQLARQSHRQTGYHLKVGGVVVGSWAGGAPNKSIAGAHLRYARTGMVPNRQMAVRRGGTNGGQVLNNGRQPRNQGNNASITRTISRNVYGGKINRNRKSRNRKDKKSTATKSATADKETTDGKKETDATKENEPEKDDDDVKDSTVPSIRKCTVELLNGTTVLASDLANSMCAEILKDNGDAAVDELLNAKKEISYDATVLVAPAAATDNIVDNDINQDNANDLVETAGSNVTNGKATTNNKKKNKKTQNKTNGNNGTAEKNAADEIGQADAVVVVKG